MAMVSVIKMNQVLVHTEGTCGTAGREATARGEEGIAELSDVPTQGCQRKVIGE